MVELHYRLLVMNSIRAFQSTDHSRVVKVRGIVVHSLLSDTELNDLLRRGTGERRAFVSGGTPHPPPQSG